MAHGLGLGLRVDEVGGSGTVHGLVVLPRRPETALDDEAKKHTPESLNPEIRPRGQEPDRAP